MGTYLWCKNLRVRTRRQHIASQHDKERILDSKKFSRKRLPANTPICSAEFGIKKTPRNRLSSETDWSAWRSWFQRQLGTQLLSVATVLGWPVKSAENFAGTSLISNSIISWINCGKEWGLYSPTRHLLTASCPAHAYALLSTAVRGKQVNQNHFGLI